MFYAVISTCFKRVEGDIYRHLNMPLYFKNSSIDKMKVRNKRYNRTLNSNIKRLTEQILDSWIALQQCRPTTAQRRKARQMSSFNWGVFKDPIKDSLMFLGKNRDLLCYKTDFHGWSPGMAHPRHLCKETGATQSSKTQESISCFVWSEWEAYHFAKLVCSLD